jgi:hypothetical protein
MEQLFSPCYRLTTAILDRLLGIESQHRLDRLLKLLGFRKISGN